jgi:LuxR family transcriptional regulator, maltose regulon positive regulatory protein
MRSHEPARVGRCGVNVTKRHAARSIAPAGQPQPATARTGAAERPPLKVKRLTRPPFEFVDAKIQVPNLRPGTVSRTGLVNRLRAATSSTVVTLTAPAGYGKTTLLAQWAARDSRPFAWVSIDDRDNDPVVLLRHFAASLGRFVPLQRRVQQSLGSPRPSALGSTLTHLAAVLRSAPPIVVVLDDCNLIRSRDSLNVVSTLLDAAANGSIVVLSGRAAPRLRVARIRAAGSLLELGVDDLALTNREAQLLLRATGIDLTDAQIEELIEQCEGWPAALYLGSLALRDGKRTSTERVRFGGDDKYLADYFRSEYLSRLRPGALRFLRRTSILGKMCGSLCDAVLDDSGSRLELEKIERSNLFLIALDHRREWYRYHHLFRELLERELSEREPELVPVLHSRAADWYEAHDDRESALDHAFAGGDTDRTAAILMEIGFDVYSTGRVVTLERWLARFERGAQLTEYPLVAIYGAHVHAGRGRLAKAERWLDSAALGVSSLPEDRQPQVRGSMAVLRAVLCREGARQMLDDASSALDDLDPGSAWRPTALLLQGAALMLLGEDERAETAFAEAASGAAALGLSETQAVALSERALLAADRQDYAVVEQLSREARECVTDAGIEHYPARASQLAISARVHLRRGRWDEARSDLTAALELIPDLTVSVPWLAVQVRLELARGFITLRDRAAARALLDEAGELLSMRSGLGLCVTQAKELVAEHDAIPLSGTGNFSGLTAAELRLLPLLATHLSFREIADELHVSRNTIKTQAISVYRKLGVSSRSDAIAEAIRLGLSDSTG